jgi:hypothetical protein
MDFLEWGQKQCKKRGIPMEWLMEPTPGSQTSPDTLKAEELID